MNQHDKLAEVRSAAPGAHTGTYHISYDGRSLCTADRATVGAIHLRPGHDVVVPDGPGWGSRLKEAVEAADHRPCRRCFGS